MNAGVPIHNAPDPHIPGRATGARKRTRLLWLLALFIAAATIAASFAGLKPVVAPEPVPDACALVSEKTVAALVGPTLSAPSESSPDPQSSDSCWWTFAADTDADDTIPRPNRRQLYVFASTFSEEPCDPFEDLVAARTIAGVGREAAIEMYNGPDETLLADKITYCMDDTRSVTVSFLGVDQIRGNWQKLPPDSVEETLLRLARETELRWAAAPRATPQSQPPAPASPSAAVVDPCRLVTPDTAVDLGVTSPPRPLGEAPGEAASSTVTGLDCLWLDPNPAVQKRLVVTVVAYADHDGHDAATWANLHHDQWTRAWTARDLAGLGERAAVASDGYAAVVWTIDGTSAIKVEFRDVPRPIGDNAEPPPTAALEATAERVAREVIANLPR